MPISSTDEILLNHIQNQKPNLQHNHDVLCILEGDLLKFVLADLKEQLSPEVFKTVEPNVSPLNFLTRIIDKLSKIYQQAPQRTIVDGSDSDKDLLEDYIKAFQMDPVMNVGNEMFNAFKTNLNQPYLDPNGFPKLRVIPNDRFVVYSDDMIDQTRPTHVMLPWGKNVIKGDPSNTDAHLRNDRKLDLWKVYTEDFIYIMDTEGNRTQDPAHPGFENPFGVLPFTYANDSKLFLIPPQDSDTFRMSVLLPKLMSLLNHAVTFQSFSIIWGIDLDDEEMKIAPNAFWRLKSDPASDKKPEIGQIKPQVDIADTIQLITTELSMWLNSRNIRPGSVSDLSAQNMVSGISKLVDEMDTSDERKKQVEIYKSVEEKFWLDLMHKIHPVWVQRGLVNPKFQSLFSANAKVEVSFTEQLPMLRRGQLVTDLANEVAAGFVSRETAIAKLNPEWSEERLAEEIATIDGGTVIEGEEEEDQVFTGNTSEDEGHSHTYNIDKDGNGDTSVADGHSHQIRGGSVQEADGHSHVLRS